MPQDKIKIPPPPRKEDVLFRDDLPDWQYNACLNVMGTADEYAYTQGYLRGAQRLVEHVLNTRRERDVLIYPIVFLYRHHIELILKKIVLRSPFLIDRELTETEKQHLGKHRLDLLWQDLKPILQVIGKASGTRVDVEDIDGIDAYIRQLSKFDPDSFCFRYARSKKGDPSLPDDLKRINIRHFAETMERLSVYLEGIDFVSDQLEEWKAEMEAEYRREMASYMDWG